MLSDLYSLAVLLGGIGLLMAWVVRGHSVYVVAPLSAFAALVASGSDPLAGMTGPYMTGFSEYMRRYLPVFLLGAMFGKLMEDSGGVAVLAGRVGRAFGPARACWAVVLACALLTYGGVSLFVVGFSAYPLAVRLFRDGNLPRRFIPAAIAFGTITFTMTSAGSPAIQNLIPIPILGTDPRAGWPVSLAAAVVMVVTGQWYLDRAIRVAVQRGERFEPRDSDGIEREAQGIARPGVVRSLVPLLVTVLSLNLLPLAVRRAGAWLAEGAGEATLFGRWGELLSRFPENPVLSIGLGVVAALVLLRRTTPAPWASCGTAASSGILACAATSSVVGFGAILQGLPAFKMVVDAVIRLPVDPLTGAALAMGVIAMIAGSASGGQGIALPIFKTVYLEGLGVPARALHRVVALASGTFDSLPSNGYIVILIRNICGETHAGSYGAIFVTTVLVPILGTIVALGLFQMFPDAATY
jgi:H+/gluconate symporter-like permease